MSRAIPVLYLWTFVTCYRVNSTLPYYFIVLQMKTYPHSPLHGFHQPHSFQSASFSESLFSADVRPVGKWRYSYTVQQVGKWRYSYTVQPLGKWRYICTVQPLGKWRYSYTVQPPPPSNHRPLATTMSSQVAKAFTLPNRTALDSNSIHPKFFPPKWHAFILSQYDPVKLISQDDKSVSL